MKPDSRRVEGGRGKETSPESISEADIVLEHLDSNRRYLGPGWLDETLVVLAGLKRLSARDEE